MTQATLNHLSGTNKVKTTESSKTHLLNMPLAVEEHNGNVRHLEDMMRASQKSGLLKMLQSHPKENRDQHHTTLPNDISNDGNRSFIDGATESNQRVSMLQQPTTGLNDLGSDISVTTPSVAGDITPPLGHEQTVKAKHRLETICTLLS